MLVRAYSGIADELDAAGYSATDVQCIKRTLDRSIKLREIIRHASGESIDLKAYEADMRHLIDTYIEADEPRKISPFDALPLLELIVKSGLAEAINNLPEGIKSSRDAIAETIENNVRSKIIKDHLNDPAFYESMSLLLDELIASRRRKAIDYEVYLKQMAELANRVASGHAEETPAQLNTPGRRALYNNLKLDRTGNVDLDLSDEPTGYKGRQDEKLRLAMMIDETVKRVRPNGWRGVKPKENIIKGALFEVLQDADEVERLFLVIERQREY
jgi:type I restriction enzyme R subunit